MPNQPVGIELKHKDFGQFIRYLFGYYVGMSISKHLVSKHECWVLIFLFGISVGNVQYAGDISGERGSYKYDICPRVYLVPGACHMTNPGLLFAKNTPFCRHIYPHDKPKTVVRPLRFRTGMLIPIIQCILGEMRPRFWMMSTRAEPIDEEYVIDNNRGYAMRMLITFRRVTGTIYFMKRAHFSVIQH